MSPHTYGGKLLSYSFVRLLAEDGSWDAFEADWRSQCERLEEDFDSYAGATFEVLHQIIKVKQAKSGVFAVKYDESYVAMCQVNCALIPKYLGPVLRTRFITFSPEYDLTDEHLHLYSRTLVELLFGVIDLGMGAGEFASRHVKLHLQSPEDAKFFTAVERNLKGQEPFESVETRGQWLYLSRK